MKLLRRKGDELPRVVVGIGGGSTMDVAKAVSVMLTNPGSSADYQGWDLVKNKAVPKIAVPYPLGNGGRGHAHGGAHRAGKKAGDQQRFQHLRRRPDGPGTLKTVPADQEFYTGMDNFIHCVESTHGSAMNALGRPFALQAKAAVENFFLKEKNYAEFMVGSFLGGCSIANSSVGICHALSYGIAFILGYRHGIANSIVFNQLEEFYGEDVLKFRQMMQKTQRETPVRGDPRSNPRRNSIR